MPAELGGVVAVDRDGIDSHLQPLLRGQLRHHRARRLLNYLRHRRATLPLLALELEVKEQVARPSHDLVGMPMLRWHQLVRRQKRVD